MSISTICKQNANSELNNESYH